jgi:hypothetical protein
VTNGNGVTPGNPEDADRGTAASGGTPAVSGMTGLVKISW